MQVRSYYSSHPDLISTLPNNIKKLFHDYVNRYSVAKVRAILGDSKELSYEFIGITDSWLTNTSIIEYKISKVLSVRDEQLRIYMPKKAMTILQAVKTMISDVKYFAYLLNEGLMAEYKSIEFPNIEDVTIEMNQDDDGSQIVAGHANGQPYFEFQLWGKCAARMLTDTTYQHATVLLVDEPLFGINNALMVMYALATASLQTALFHSSVSR